MSVEEIIRSWRDLDYVETLEPEAKSRIPENPAGSVALLDREVGPRQVPPWVEGLMTCEEPACGDTCPPPGGSCLNTCFTSSTCCC